MAPARVSEKDVLEIWNSAKQRQDSIPHAQPKFGVGQHVRISKQRMKFAKKIGTEFFYRNIQNYQSYS
jgi:hypothetical protein